MLGMPHEPQRADRRAVSVFLLYPFARQRVGRKPTKILRPQNKEKPPGGVSSDRASERHYAPISQLRELLGARKMCQRCVAASFRLTL
jgi:hypothetical protein